MIFKTKNLSLGNVSANGDNTWGVVRGWSCKRVYHGIWVFQRPCSGREEPIQLGKKGVILHIALGEGPSFDWKFNQSQVADNFIESFNVLHIGPRSISAIRVSIKVKITHN